MLRVWGKLWAKNRIAESCTIEDADTTLPPEMRMKHCLDQIVRAFDLPMPIILPSNQDDLKRFGQTRFTADHFVEHFPYQSLEIEIIERDDDEKDE